MCHFVDQLYRISFKSREFSHGLHSVSCQSDQVSCFWPLTFQILKLTDSYFFCPWKWFRTDISKIVELFSNSIAVHTGGLAKNRFWLVATPKKRIGEQLNHFWNMCPKPFSCAKNKGKLVFDGKSSGLLLARAALKCLHLCHNIISMPRKRCDLILKVLIQCSVQPDNWLILQRNFYTSIVFGLTEHRELNTCLLFWSCYEDYCILIPLVHDMRLSGKIHNAKSSIILKTGYCVLQIKKHFT